MKQKNINDDEKKITKIIEEIEKQNEMTKQYYELIKYVDKIKRRNKMMSQKQYEELLKYAKYLAYETK